MGKTTLTYRAAEEFQEMAVKLQAATSGTMHAYSDLKNTFSSVRGNLADLEDDVEAMINQAEKSVNAIQEASQGIPEKLNEVANAIVQILQKHMTANP